MSAGKLNFRVELHKRTQVGNGSGSKVGGFELIGEVWADISLRRGGEGVFAARQSGHQPAILTVRANSISKQITQGWKVMEGDIEWNVKEPPRLTKDRAYFEMLIERGRGNV